MADQLEPLTPQNIAPLDPAATGVDQPVRELAPGSLSFPDGSASKRAFSIGALKTDAKKTASKSDVGNPAPSCGGGKPKKGNAAQGGKGTGQGGQKGAKQGGKGTGQGGQKGAKQGAKGAAQEAHVGWDDNPNDLKRGYHGPGTVGNSKHMINTYDGWGDLKKAGIVNDQDQHTINAMSPNEGGMDAAQAYEMHTGAVVSVGAMQKIMDTKGGGELTNQLRDFQKNSPTKYQELFADKGWTLKGGEQKPVLGKNRQPKIGKDGKPVMKTEPTKLYYKDPNDPNMKPLTGKALRGWLQNDANKDQATKAVDSLHKAGQDRAFQDQQVRDFKKRLDQSGKVNVPGYNHPTGAYLTSEAGRAMLLDHSVNAPNNVGKNFASALNKFYNSHPPVKDPTGKVIDPGPTRNPYQWTPAQRTQYEKEILDNYAGHKAVPANPATNTSAIAAKSGTRVMTNPDLRRDNILNSVAKGHLSSEAGSFGLPVQ